MGGKGKLYYDLDDQCYLELVSYSSITHMSTLYGTFRGIGIIDLEIIPSLSSYDTVMCNIICENYHLLDGVWVNNVPLPLYDMGFGGSSKERYILPNLTGDYTIKARLSNSYAHTTISIANSTQYEMRISTYDGTNVTINPRTTIAYKVCGYTDIDYIHPVIQVIVPTMVGGIYWFNLSHHYDDIIKTIEVQLNSNHEITTSASDLGDGWWWGNGKVVTITDIHSESGDI